MRIAFIIRSTLHTVPGGDTIQIEQTAKCLRELGVTVDVLLTNSRINYSGYDGFHFFNINRPADILFHISRIKVPIFVSPVLVDYSEYDKHYRNGFSGTILKHFSPSANEYIKTISRWATGNDLLQSKSYLYKGQQKSIREIVNKTTAFLPNSEREYQDLKKIVKTDIPYSVVPNGIDNSLFIPDEKIVKDDRLVICAARIEGIKNQWNLIKALNDTEFTLLLIGSPAPNQKAYDERCRKIASKNIMFENHMTQEALINYYKKAKVHVLPSWFETCGLSSLEAAAMGCNIIITEKGYAREYFGNEAFYCNPASPPSILEAITEASQYDGGNRLQQRVLHQYTWQQAAAITLSTYKNYTAR